MSGKSIGARFVTIVLAAITGGMVGVFVFLALEWSRPAVVELSPVTPSAIVVQIDGEVQEPGLVTIAAGSRLAEAIDAAGGLTENADVSRLNLAQRLGDGDHITIPDMQEQAGTIVTGGTPDAEGESGLIDINSAELIELQQLPGIGPVIAQRIIDFREFYGPFTSIDQLDEVNGISPEMVDELRPLVTIVG